MLEMNVIEIFYQRYLWFILLHILSDIQYILLMSEKC